MLSYFEENIFENNENINEIIIDRPSKYNVNKLFIKVDNIKESVGKSIHEPLGLKENVIKYLQEDVSPSTLDISSAINDAAQFGSCNYSRPKIYHTYR